MLIHHRADFNHRFYQLLRRQDITQAQGWIEYLTHCARVDDPAGVIESLQTWERGTGITKLRVMIVLENVSIALARKINESGPARRTHRHAERELMGRGDVNYFGRRLFRRPRDHDSFPVNRSRNHGRPGEAKNSASLVESGIFNPRDLTTIDQAHRADHHRLLRSSGDDNLVRMPACASVIT